MSPDLASLVILRFPDPVLHRRAEPVGEVTDEVRAVVERMFELTEEADGLGLAAPQIGFSWRLFVTSDHEGEPARVYINPVLSNPSGEPEVNEEGCLSLPEIHVDVRRSPEISIDATSLDGKEFTLRSNQLIARVWQHEMDHLDGILIIDKMGPMDRLSNRKAIKELRAAATE